jgi:hypothetical protein
MLPFYTNWCSIVKRKTLVFMGFLGVPTSEAGFRSGPLATVRWRRADFPASSIIREATHIEHQNLSIEVELLAHRAHVVNNLLGRTIHCRAGGERLKIKVSQPRHLPPADADCNALSAPNAER